MENNTYGTVALLHCDDIQPEMHKKTRRGRRTPKRLSADPERTKVGQTHKDRNYCRLSTPGAPSNDNSFLIDDKSENVNYDNCDEPNGLPDEFNEYHTLYLDSQDVGYCSSSPSSEFSASHRCSPSHDLDDPCNDYYTNNIEHTLDMSSTLYENIELEYSSECLCVPDGVELLESDNLFLYKQLQHLPKEVLIHKILNLQPNRWPMLEQTEPADYEPQADSSNGDEISPVHQKYTV